jgi:DNA polymerase-3 subunit delta'
MSAASPHVRNLLFSSVVGQEHAIEQLQASMARPFHCYLLVGPGGPTKRRLARGFAAGLLCEQGGCGSCDSCRRTLSGVHPDLVEVERTGASLEVDEARSVVRLAHRKPMESRRQVVVVEDLHLARLAAPVLLKTLEEPPGQTVFLLLADHLGPGLETIASRSVIVELEPVATAEIVSWLVGLGFERDAAAEAARAARGSVERAELLARDSSLSERRRAWREVPARLDGTGATATKIAEELLEATAKALAPLEARQAAELEALDAAEKDNASIRRAAPDRKQLVERHHREQRRHRTEEIRAGLGELAAAYRDRLVALTSSTSGPGKPDATRGSYQARYLARAVALVEEASAALVRNPNESLLLEALLIRLSDMASGV